MGKREEGRREIVEEREKEERNNIGKGGRRDRKGVIGAEFHTHTKKRSWGGSCVLNPMWIRTFEGDCTSASPLFTR